MSEPNVAADQLRLFIERIERLEEEKKGIADDIKDVYSEAKSDMTLKPCGPSSACANSKTMFARKPKPCWKPINRHWAWNSSSAIIGV